MILILDLHQFNDFFENVRVIILKSINSYLAYPETEIIKF